MDIWYNILNNIHTNPMFYQKTIDESLGELESSNAGLKTSQIEALREKHRFNELPQKKKSLILLFLQQFNDILVFILIGALGLSIAMPFLEGHAVTVESFVDAFVILAILILNAMLGFVQEFKAEEAIAMLEKLTSPNARVRRDGEETVIASKELLPGDVVVLEAGDKISADGRLLSESHFRTNESSLTGESKLINKQLEKLDGDKPLAEQSNMVFSGTLVAAGAAECLITATGVNTEIGKIAKLVSETEIPETPLQIRMKKLGKMLGAFVLVLCALVLAEGFFTDKHFIELLLIAVSLAVSAVPEGLPAVVTVCFAMGVKRMVKKNALVRRLDSLETLGSVNVICSDKTGTITENRMKVVETWLPEKAAKADATLLVEIGSSCNRAKLPDLGDPTEIGLLEYAKDKNIDPIAFDEEVVPFTSEEKYMKTRHGDRMFLKGAPEKIIEMCTDVDEKAVHEKDLEMSKKGIRVLGCAVEENGTMRFVGLIGMEDPPRASAKQAIKEAKEAGIRSVMITGDNLETARAIGHEVGIEGDAMHGRDLDAMSDAEFEDAVLHTSVYARVSPVHKLRILEALQKQGFIVAMSGDGVNDAPALKGAHVGVSMGKVGTQVAREASSIVLADDHFSTIVVAIKEGRRIYDNIKKFVMFLLRANFDEILLIMTAIAVGIPLPYLPIHILWINLMTDGLPALALGLEKAEPDIMKRPPRPTSEGILSGEWGRLVIAAFIAFGLAFFLFKFQLDAGVPLETARSVTLTMAIVFELLLAFNARSQRPLWEIGFFSNKWLCGAVVFPFLAHLAILYTPMHEWFKVAPLNLQQWAVVLGMAFSGFVVFELMKLIPKKKHKDGNEAIGVKTLEAVHS